MSYDEFLRSKVELAASHGFEVPVNEIAPRCQCGGMLVLYKTRWINGVKHRRRECERCGKRWLTRVQEVVVRPIRQWGRPQKTAPGSCE